jgi:hypothetical protein
MKLSGILAIVSRQFSLYILFISIPSFFKFFFISFQFKFTAK